MLEGCLFGGELPGNMHRENSAGRITALNCIVTQSDDVEEIVKNMLDAGMVE